MHGINGISITGRGRPASVDVDLLKIQDMHNTSSGGVAAPAVTNVNAAAAAAAAAQIARRNISAASGIYICDYN